MLLIVYEWTSACLSSGEALGALVPIETKINNQSHIPVLLTHVLMYLDPKEGETYLDLTAGYGGHASAVLERTKNPAGTVLVDRDEMAVTRLKQRFKDVDVQRADFFAASEELISQGKHFDIILADLGLSSPHLDIPSRGFAIASDGPLDMRMDQSQPLTAEIIVNTYATEDLVRILHEYGEEPRAKRIVELIEAARPLTSTAQLAQTVAKAYPGHSRTHPATRTFQALRIAVNDELTLLRRSLPLWFILLNPGGRLGIISFHSLEDRIVKNAIREVSGNRYDAEFQELTKRPATASHDEVVFNPRARSAKLRAAVKIKRERETHANTG
jgi:16S rRNA (cytosine1402-N4)-methyltransferase